MIAQETGASIRKVSRNLEVPRSSVSYKPKTAAPASGKRGPKTEVSDEALLAAIRKVIAESPFHGEGHRKIRARLRAEGIRTGRCRILRLCRLHGLLAPSRAVHTRGNPAHDGTIIEIAPDRTWGTDFTTFMTGEGKGYFFLAIDHCTDEVLGWHVTDQGNRWSALEPIRQAVRRVKGVFEKDVCRGIRLRHDNGSQYVAKDFQGEIRFLGIESSPSYVREPEGNGIAERFMRTLKEQLLWCRHFATIEEARRAVEKFIAAYNDEWLLARHGYRSPSAVRAGFMKAAA